jgi:hypothetical protein
VRSRRWPASSLAGSDIVDGRCLSGLPSPWAGFVLLALAAVLVLLPEVGLPALFGALALLALEFDWAARLLGGAVRLAERVRGRFVSLPTLTRLAVIAIPVLIVVTAVVLVTGLGVSPI